MMKHKSDDTWTCTKCSQDVILCDGKTEILECPKCDMELIEQYTLSGKYELYKDDCEKCGKYARTLVDGVCNTCLSKEDPDDNINWPSHYNTGSIQPIDAIEDWKLDFRLANAVKYIARTGKKDPAKAKEDLEKAIWYVQRFIDKELN